MIRLRCVPIDTWEVPDKDDWPDWGRGRTVGLRQSRAQQKLIRAYMAEIRRRAEIWPPQSVPQEFAAENMADRHRIAFEMALHEVGVGRFGSPAEVQALEQVCIGEAASWLGMPPQYVPAGGWPTWAT